MNLPPTIALTTLLSILITAMLAIKKWRKYVFKTTIIGAAVILVLGLFQPAANEPANFNLGNVTGNSGPVTQTSEGSHQGQVTQIVGDNNRGNVAQFNNSPNAKQIINPEAPKPRIIGCDYLNINEPQDGHYQSRISLWVAYPFAGDKQQDFEIVIDKPRSYGNPVLQRPGGGFVAMSSGEQIPYREYIFTWQTTNKMATIP